MTRVLLLVLLLLPGTAMAWERTMTCGDRLTPCAENMVPLPTYWVTPCIGFHLNESGTSHIAFKDVESVVKKSISTWLNPELSSLYPYYSGETNETRIGYNPYIKENANIIVFRDGDTWQESRTMMALTTVTHKNSTGVIYDADIEINTSDFRYGIYEKDGADVVDLQNTLTHEIGHVFGLSHSSDMDATMFPYASTGETNLRTLGSDDLDGISTIYPPNSKAKCEEKQTYFERPPYEMNEGPASSDGCSTHPRGSFGGFFILFSSLWMILRVRRRFA